ncbi:MAG: chorismate synthase [Nitrospira sp.]|nr:chorismate synthase [bacterium]MBL7049005.1 chorismate synthase [Nitrospira sp.]
MFNKLRYITAGESHGQALVCTIDGMPSNLKLKEEYINVDLAKRQRGYGRGGRMKIETDKVQILTGVRWGKTLGSPIAMLINNMDWENWSKVMSLDSANEDPSVHVTRPRPGHADLTGSQKYDFRDARNVLERSSARETAAKVAAGAVARRLLEEFGVQINGYVTEIGGAGIKDSYEIASNMQDALTIAEISTVRCPDKKAEAKMIRKIKAAMKTGDTLGGIFEIVVTGLPAGIGSYTHWDKRLEAKIAASVMGIQAIKGVEVGLGFDSARRPGSEVMDEIYYRSSKKAESESAGGFYRKTNNAGGIEGGMSNGMPIIIRAAMKPIPTLKSPLSSVDINSKKKFNAAYERSDTCAVPAASVVGEAAVALAVADSFLDKFGGDSIAEIKRNYEGYLKQLRNF